MIPVLTDFYSLLAALVAGHFLCDFPLQGDFLAKAKNHTQPIAGVPWQWALAAHSAIHAGSVLLITGSLWLAAGQFALHALTDMAKCAGKIGFSTDQALHLVVIVITAAAAALGALA
jgi:hypothetical protein